MGLFDGLASLFTKKTEAEPMPIPPLPPEPPRDPALIKVLSRLDEPACPYCGCDFPTMPKRRRKCPYCSQYVQAFVHKPTDSICLLTEAEAANWGPKWAYVGDRQFHSSIAGVTYPNDDGSDRQQLLRKCYREEPLALIRRPIPQDRNAVAVCLQSGEQLGWLKAEVAEEVTDWLDHGLSAEAHVSEVTGGTRDKPTRGCNIWLHLKGL